MRLFIADNQEKVRYALRALLEKNPDVRITGEASSIKSLQDKISASEPDVLIIDWMLLDERSNEFIRKLRFAAPKIKIIILSSRPEHKEEVLNAGADAFISKIDPPDKLLAAISELV
jgi:two-component system NarL family response regulator